MGVAARLLTFRGVVEYEGTGFSGWQEQPGARTVQGVLEEALRAVLGQEVALLAAGRTDAGVHAEGQAVSFRAATRIPPRGIAAACNARLPDDVAFLALERVPAAFHATRSARWKTYRYEILNRREPSPLRCRRTWRVPGALDQRRMAAAARVLRGTHDFRTFRSNPGPARAGEDTVRTLRAASVRRRGDLLVLEFRGDGFLHHMVRNIVGTLVQVGRGSRSPADVRRALLARDRAAGGPTAPAFGLTLVEVEYGS